MYDLKLGVRDNMGSSITSGFQLIHDVFVESEFLISDEQIARLRREFVVLVSARKIRFTDPFNPNEAEKDAIEARARSKLPSGLRHRRIRVGLHSVDGEVLMTNDMIFYKVIFHSTSL